MRLSIKITYDNMKFKKRTFFRASSAAPGYFDEMHLNGKIHHDGGILTNNPSLVAIHEAQKLWPGENPHCVVSLGMGRSERPVQNQISAENGENNKLSLAKKFSRIVDAATDTEIAHVALHDLLPGHVYFRFNPILREYTPLDETRPEKMKNLREDTKMYLRRNQNRVLEVCGKLQLKRAPIDTIKDWAKKEAEIFKVRQFKPLNSFRDVHVF